jgi:hypothetical protein
MNIDSLTPSQLRQAADLKDQLAVLEQQLAGIIVVGGKPRTPVDAPELASPARPGKRTMSPAHKAKIRAAQQLRWAKYNAGRSATATAEAAEPAKRGPKKGGMSAAGRARIAEAQRLRWAKVKGGKKTQSPTLSKTKPARKMSAAGRAAIAAAAKARWAKFRAGKK